MPLWRWIAAGALAGALFAVASAAQRIVAHGYLEQGLSHLALVTFRGALLEWVHFGAAAGALVAWLLHVARRAGPPEGPLRLGPLLGAVARAGLPFLATGLYIWVMEPHGLHTEALHVVWTVLHLLLYAGVLLAVALLYPLRRARWQAILARRSAGLDPTEAAVRRFQRVFWWIALPVALIDAAALLPGMPHGLVPMEAIRPKVLFDAFALAAVWLAAPASRSARLRPLRRVPAGVWLAPAAGAALLLLGLVAVAGAARPAPGSRPNVVLIVVDALRSDHLSAYGYERDTSPYLDSLAATRAALFRNVYSSATMSKPSLTSVLTSTHPSVHGALDEWAVVSPRLLTLPELLRNAGYQTVLFNAGNPYLYPHFGVAQGFDRNHQRLNEGGPLLTTEFLAELPALARRGPFFAYLHYMDVHTPYAVNDFNRMFRKQLSDRLGMVWGTDRLRISLTEISKLGNEDADARESMIALYDGQIRLIDGQVRRVVEGLAQQGILDNTFVLFTADHGEELWDHGGFGHGHALYEEGLRVPLFLLGPGISPVEIDTRVRLIDLFPTILEAVGVDPPRTPLQGSSLWTALAGDEPDRPVFAELGDDRVHHRMYAVIEGRDKLYVFRSPETETRVLFDLETDPREQRDVAKQYPQRVEALTARLDAYAAEGSAASGAAAVERELPGEVEDQLRALGYLENAPEKKRPGE